MPLLHSNYALFASSGMINKGGKESCLVSIHAIKVAAVITCPLGLIINNTLWLISGIHFCLVFRDASVTQKDLFHSFNRNLEAGLNAI